MLRFSVVALFPSKKKVNTSEIKDLTKKKAKGKCGNGRKLKYLCFWNLHFHPLFPLIHLVPILCQIDFFFFSFALAKQLSALCMPVTER